MTLLENPEFRAFVKSFNYQVAEGFADKTLACEVSPDAAPLLDLCDDAAEWIACKMRVPDEVARDALVNWMLREYLRTTPPHEMN